MLRQEHCKLIEAAQESLGRSSVIINSPYSSRSNGFREPDERASFNSLRLVRLSIDVPLTGAQC